MKEMEFVENKSLRDQSVERVEVLEKVKALFLIPGLEMMTTKQVADFYEVDVDTIKKCYTRNKSEIDKDGVCVKDMEFWKGHFVPAKSKQRGSTTFKLEENIYLVIPNSGKAKCFSKRAILRIGMLLRDSRVAQEVRTQLLNTFEKASIEQKVEDIEKEQTLYMAYAKAAIDGSKEDLVNAARDIFDYKNRYIKAIEEEKDELQQNNKMLVADILRWSDRASLNKAVRAISAATGKWYGSIWSKLYSEIRYKSGIGLSQRGKPPYVQYIKKDEWPIVQQSLCAICEEYGLSPTKIFEKAKINLEGERE